MKTTPAKSKRKPAVKVVVTIGGVRAMLRFHRGLFFASGILLPGGGETVFKSEKSAQRAVDRTQRASRRLRTSLVAEFVQDKVPELGPLFGELEFDFIKIEPVKK
ncbi:MAG: hypothetical protein WC661_22115 [Opitutaceae bacterium]|jgi:hypothetical protein